MWVETDHGLFGPGSVTWRILGEPVMWVAGLRAARRRRERERQAAAA